MTPPSLRPDPQAPAPPRPAPPDATSLVNLMHALAAAVYICDTHGRVTHYNEAAAALWGRRPEIGKDLWCGSWKIFTPDGGPVPLDTCPMAVSLKEARSVRGIEIVVERPDGTRRHVLPHPEPLRDDAGNVVGGVNMLLDITEQREAEAARARLAAIVESSDDAIISKTLDGQITTWNAGAQRIFGYAADEIVGRPITTLIPRDRLPEEDAILHRLRRGERIDHYHTLRRTKDGRLIDVSLSISPVRDASGRLIGASKIARDISAQIRAEQHLRRSEQSLADFFENAPLGLHWVDARGIIIRANRSELETLGYAADEYVGRPIADFHADPAVADEMLSRLAAGETLVEFPARMRCKDGSIRHVRVSSNVLREDGEFVHTRCFSRDVTDQVAAQEFLARSESNLRALLSLLPVAVYSCDADGRINFFNHRAVELWGLEPDLRDTRFCACYRVYLPDGTLVPPDRTPMAIAVKEGKPFRDLEAIFERPDGRRVHVSVNIDPVRDESGRLCGAINAFQDISVQVAARESLEHQQRALEDAVARRTAELEDSHRRLRISERLAAVGTLSVGLGHDMGNILVPVRVSLGALAQAGLPRELDADVERIRTAAQYLQQLANGLRMMALDPLASEHADPLEVKAWWSDAMPIVKNSLPRGVSLESDVADDLWLRIPRPALTQATFNLAQNAGEALRGRLDGIVRFSARRDADNAILLSVEDNGPGMSREVLDRCMEPFFTTKPRAISTGLGLILVSGIVREAGGTVRIDSEPGRGTAFHLSFPACPPPAPQSPAVPGRRALVDLRDARLRSLVAHELRHLDFEVVPDPCPDDPELDVAVTDASSRPVADLKARRIVLLAAANGHPSHVHAIGRAPGPSVIRRTLQQLARDPGPAQAAAE